jgi:hypothetical protein
MNFITGNKFKRSCHYSYDEQGFIKHTEPKDGEILRIFVKIDYVHSFFIQSQERPYVLFTHNGDLPVDDNYLRYMVNSNLLKWYGQNIMTHHPKLVSIPIGLGNEIWPHGDEKVFNEVIDQNIPKERLIYVNFDVNTNRRERNYCLNEINKNGLEMGNKLPFKEYLEEVAKSYFVVSPNGNGVDCHKTWESLYLGAIPIVTKSTNIDFYKNFPIIAINDWSEFNPSDFTIDLFVRKWGHFDSKLLDFKRYDVR